MRIRIEQRIGQVFGKLTVLGIAETRGKRHIMNSYEAFRDWALANGYSDTLEIDRINTNGNYEPENCRWATRKEQMANTRKRRDGVSSVFKGVSWNPIGRNWKVQVNRNGKNTYVGVFKSELKAALAYDDAALTSHGPCARLNFPERHVKRPVPAPNFGGAIGGMYAMG